MKHLNNFQIFNEMSKESTVRFEDFPEDVLKTLDEEYARYYQHNFDWNSKQDEFEDNPEGFRSWMENNKQESFIENLDLLITKTREDLINKIRDKNANTALENFEELIKPTLGNEVLVQPLSKYMEKIMLFTGSGMGGYDSLSPEQTIKAMEKAFQDAKNIIEPDGSINQEKIDQSEIFVGGDISVPGFERFAKNNPEYQGVFNDWKKLLDIALFPKELNAYRDTTSYERIRKLYDFLMDYRKIKGYKAYRPKW